MNSSRDLFAEIGLSEKVIDLLETERKYTDTYGPLRVSRDRFGAPIVGMSRHAIGKHPRNPYEIQGIRSCLTWQVGRVSWREYLWGIPVPTKTIPFTRGPFGGCQNQSELELLVDSLVASTLHYRSALWNVESLATTHLILGFELVCDWIASSVPLTKDRNPVIVDFCSEPRERSSSC